jgi:hypothetical protein
VFFFLFPAWYICRGCQVDSEGQKFKATFYVLYNWSRPYAYAYVDLRCRRTLEESNFEREQDLELKKYYHSELKCLKDG